MSRWALTAAAMIGLMYVGCDSYRAQDDFAAEASRPPEGFTRTENGIDVESDDPDDWRTAPLFAGKVRVDPAFPNPAGDVVVTVPFSVLDFDAVRGGLVLYVRSNVNGSLTRLDQAPEATQPGAYVFTFPAPVLGSSGLHRLYVVDGASEIVSYGDLMVR